MPAHGCSDATHEDNKCIAAVSLANTWSVAKQKPKAKFLQELMAADHKQYVLSLMGARGIFCFQNILIN